MIIRKNLELKEQGGWWSLPLGIFLTLVTAKFPKCHVFPGSIHESIYNFKILYKI
jgi:hypothetical protein